MSSEQNKDNQPIVLRDMGSFMYGGTVDVKEDGETFHCNHGYAQYFVPQEAKNYPIVFWHGQGQSGRCWESTPEGKDGFWQIFTKRNYATFIIDQCQRGRAGRTNNVSADGIARPYLDHEAFSYGVFRNGVWAPPAPATIFEGCKGPSTPYAMDQFLRMQLPDTGCEPNTSERNYYMANHMKALLEQTGPAILHTHSHSGKYGFATGTVCPELIKAIVAYEPAHFLFPESHHIDQIDSPLGDLIYTNTNSFNVPEEEFMNLTKMPILMLWGDNIPEGPTTVYGNEVWRIGRIRAQIFADLINERGGNATVIKLPEIGITGNTHAGIADSNNVEIADVIDKWLHKMGLDGNDKPYAGPQRKMLDEWNIPLKH